MDAAGSAGRDPVFPMPMQQLPTLFFPSPPPPQTPYSYSYSSPTEPHHASSSIASFPILLLTVLGILITSVLLLTYYVFVIRCCLSWHSSSEAPGIISLSLSGRRRRRHGTDSSRSLPVHGVPTEARGLEEPAIQALPAFRYRKAVKDSTVDPRECAVCLGEFQEDERVRLLPGCLHVFHAVCIDTWLQGNANCPLCRTAITASGHSQLPLTDHDLHRPEEVVIQVVPGADEEGAQTQQQEANMAAAGSEGDAADHQLLSSERRMNNTATVHGMSAARETSLLQRG